MVNSTLMSRTLLIAEGRQRVASGDVRRIRVAARLSQQDLARPLGVTRASISLWEKLQRKISDDNAVGLAILLREIEKQSAATPRQSI